MKQKIFRNSLLVGLMVLLLCTVIFCGVTYDYAKELVYSELSVEAAYAAAGLESTGGEYMESLNTSRRITLVDAGGQVIFDNRAEASAMENHLDREEISEAISQGSGRSMHYSGTMLETTLYYALRLSDGRVLRVSAPHDSIFAVASDMLKPMAATLLLLLILCALISSRLSRQITEPINAIDLEAPEKTGIYPELEPLVNRLREQNRTIREQMDELRRKQREFSAITENMSEGLLLLDSRGGVLFSNSFALEALCGGSAPRRISRSHCDESVCLGAEAALSGEESELLLEREGRMLQLLCSPVITSGHVTGAVLLLLDVTEREKRDELRREFSANVSHELKTPLTSISGFAELMKEGLVPAERMREFSEDIYKEARRLLCLVEDIMRLSRLEEGADSPECETVELLALASSVADNLKDYAEKHGVSIEVSGTPAEFMGCRRILSEMLYNLYENAVKYNKPGGKVYVSVENGTGELQLRVRDTGIGIPQSHQSRIFERFYRVDKSHSRETGGTGLGLSIVRHAAAFHNAEIALKSEEGEGSEFTVKFPIKGEKI